MAARTSRFLKGLSVGYLAICINILYTMLSVPLALRYLGKEEFGLWSIALQVSGYLMLIDFGLSSAMSRYVADHKDDVNGGKYGEVLQIGFIVFAIQGFVITILGALFSFLATRIVAVPAVFHVEFRNILIIITIISGISVATKGFGIPLWAFQRLDISYNCFIINLITNFGFLFVGFKFGLGIYSFAYAGIPGLIITSVYSFWVCSVCKYYPSRDCWGLPRWSVFWEMLKFGKDTFYMSLGNQMVNASQLIILGRFVGLESAATYSIGTKFYSMGQLLVSRVQDSSAPGLTELYVRTEFSLFEKRFRDILVVTAIFATTVGVGLLAGNNVVVTLWTHGAIGWPACADLLLAPLLLITSISRCFISIFSITKKLKHVRYVYFIEGILFISLCEFTVKKFGISGMILSSLISHFLTSALIVINKYSKNFGQIKIMKVIKVGIGIFIISAITIGMLYKLNLNNSEKLSIALILSFLAFILSTFFIASKELRKYVFDKIIKKSYENTFSNPNPLS